MSKVIRNCFGFALLRCDWLKCTRATYATNQMQNYFEFSLVHCIVHVMFVVIGHCNYSGFDFTPLIWKTALRVTHAMV